MFKKVPKIPLGIILAGAFVLQSVLGVGLAGYLAFENGQDAVNDVASHLRSEITARIVQRLDNFTDIPEQINQQNAVLLGNGILNLQDHEAIARHFWEQVKIYDTVTSIYFGNPAGGVINSGREGADGSLYRIMTEDFASGPFYKQALNSQGNTTILLNTLPNFDARTRPWYQNALAEGQAVWNEAYILFTEQDMAIAHSQPVYNPAGELIGVASVDIFTSHLSDFLHSLRIGQNGHSYIMERSGLLIASSNDELPFSIETSTAPAQRRLASESTSPLIRESALHLQATFNNYHAIDQAENLSFVFNGERELIQVTPYSNQNGLDWLVVVVIPESDFMSQVETQNRITLFLLILALISSIILGLLAARWIVKPIQRLTKSTQSLAVGNWTSLPQPTWNLEIDELTESFNLMSVKLEQTLNSLMAEVVERKQAEAALSESNEQLEKTLLELKNIQNHLMQQERLATVGQLSAGIAHDFNNILTSILGYADLLKRTETLSTQALDSLDTVIVSARRAAQLVRQILDFSRKPIHQYQQVNLATFVKEISKFLSRTIPENISLNLELSAKDCIIEGDPTQLQQLITNLVVNAKDAMPEGGQINIKLASLKPNNERCHLCQMPLKGEWVCLSINDTGSGILPDVMSHIFEPFFTTKAPGLGTGLGLAQVYELVTRHQGHLTAETKPEHGSTFRVYFPPVSNPSFQPNQTPRALPKGHGQKILLVEDEHNVRKVAKFMLEHLSYQVVAASNGQEALALYQEQSEAIDLALLDLVLPDMDGLQLFEKLKAENEDLQGIAMSGYPLGPKKQELVSVGIQASFQKPLILQELAEILDEQLNKPTKNTETPREETSTG